MIKKCIKKIKKAILITLAACVLILVGTNMYVYQKGSQHIYQANTLSDNQADAILVLGAGLNGTEPSDVLIDRLDTAVQLYHAQKAKVLILSGDHATAYHDEVTAMKNYALAQGVPESAIFLDHYGLSTYDSLYRAKYIFSAKSLIIVTQQYHLYRAVYISEALGIETVGVASKIKQFKGQFEQDVREMFARLKAVYSIIVHEEASMMGETYDLSDDARLTH